MAGDLCLGHHGVHDAAVIRLPGVGRTAHQHAPRLLEQVRVAQRGKRAHRAGRVARHHPRRVSAQGGLIVGLGHERVARQAVLLAPLVDRLDTDRLVALQVFGTDPLGRAVHHHVGLGQQVVQGAHHRDAGPFHLVCLFRQRRVDGQV